MAGLFAFSVFLGVCVAGIGKLCRNSWIIFAGIIGIIAGTMGGCFGLPYKGAPDGNPAIVTAAMVMIAAAVVLVIVGIVIQSNLILSWNETKGIASVSSGVLSVQRRSPNLAKFLKARKHSYGMIAHKPEEYIYTAVTVGGVTTGGVTKVGGYDYVAGTVNTDRYQLMYGDEIITSIKLTPQLYQQALNSPIKGFLVADTQEIRVNVVSAGGIGNDVILGAARAGNYNPLLSDAARSYPTLKKCQMIMEWLCNP